MKKRNILSLGLVGLAFVGVLVVAAVLLMPREKADASAVGTANNLYQAGHYSEASRLYEQLIAQGIRDSVLFYNLGNAYYRQGDLGRAILNYQRAHSLDPRDPDIRSNLAAARQQVAATQVTGTPTGLAAGLAGLTASWLSLDQAALVVLALWLAIGFLLLARRLMDKHRLRVIAMSIAAALLLLLAVFGASLGSRMYDGKVLPSGVIVAPTVVLSSQPGAQNETEVELPAGTEISLREREGAWARLAVEGNEIQGWIPLIALETISEIS